jgi:hypothetical protein
MMLRRGIKVDLIELERHCLNRFQSLGADASRIVTEYRQPFSLLHRRGYFLGMFRQRLAHTYLLNS